MMHWIKEWQLGGALIVALAIILTALLGWQATDRRLDAMDDKLTRIETKIDLGNGNYTTEIGGNR